MKVKRETLLLAGLLFGRNYGRAFGAAALQ